MTLLCDLVLDILASNVVRHDVKNNSKRPDYLTLPNYSFKIVTCNTGTVSEDVWYKLGQLVQQLHSINLVLVTIPVTWSYPRKPLNISSLEYVVASLFMLIGY